MASHFLAALGEIELLEHLIEALDLTARLFEMRGEGLLELRMGGRARHFRQRLHQLLLGMVDVAQLFDEEILQGF